jgi:hypothetical protein
MSPRPPERVAKEASIFLAARGAPGIPLRIDEDPQGFIGDAQAIRAGERPMPQCARDIIAAFAGFPVLTRPLLSGLVRLWERERQKHCSRVLGKPPPRPPMEKVFPNQQR